LAIFNPRDICNLGDLTVYEIEANQLSRVDNSKQTSAHAAQKKATPAIISFEEVVPTRLRNLMTFVTWTGAHNCLCMGPVQITSTSSD